MEVQIKAIHFDISDKLVAFANKKVEKLARRFEAITDVEVNFRLIKEALDLCLDALERQLGKLKDKK